MSAKDRNGHLMSREAVIAMYDGIYQRGAVPHPDPRKKGKMLEPYGIGSKRDEHIIGIFDRYVRPHLAEEIDILDASCGRGRMLRLLDERKDITAYGTEVAPSLFEGDLKDLVDAGRIRQLAYDELPNHPRRFSVVFSNDVLEHLHDELTARLAIQHFQVLAPWCCVSLSLGRAPKWPKAMDLPVKDLHILRRPETWWIEVFADAKWDIVHRESNRANLYIAARKR